MDTGLKRRIQELTDTELSDLEGNVAYECSNAQKISGALAFFWNELYRIVRTEIRARRIRG